MYKYKAKHILIVDDDDILQDFLRKYLSSKHYQTECLADGYNLPTLLDKTRIDLIVLDIELPGKDGIYWLKWLRHYYSHIPVIIASVKTSEHDRLIGLEHGARDYLVKPFQCKELLIRIENILGGRQPLEDYKIIRFGGIELDTENCLLLKVGQDIKLTLLETNILKLLYINNGATVSRDDIMAQVRGTSYNPLDRSIDIHINKLRKKIEDDPANPAYIRTVRGKGYRLHIPNISDDSDTSIEHWR